jgi:tripartite-type tricarboxylate transporter receptor subunit TctC
MGYIPMLDCRVPATLDWRRRRPARFNTGDHNMQFKRTLITLLALGSAAVAHAQANWPTKPITLVVPFAAGGPTDVVARTLGASMTKTLGQTVVVENKLGAGGTVAANSVAKAQPDGYTFFIHHNGMATATALYRKLAYDPMKDFEFVSQAVEVPMTMLARKDFPANNFQEFVSYIRANKEKINLAAPTRRRSTSPTPAWAPCRSCAA